MTQGKKKVIAEITALTIATSGILYESHMEKQGLIVRESHQKVLEMFDEETQLDEAIDSGIATYKNKSIIEMADTLEEAIEISEMLDYYDFSEVEELDKLTKEEYEFAKTLTKEDVIILNQVINEDKDSLEFEEQKLKTIKILDYTKKEKDKFIEQNGKEIVLETLSWTIKSAIAEEFGIPVNEIEKIKIPSIKKVQDMKFYVIYNNQKYFLSSRSSSYDVMYYMYQIESTKDLKENKNEIYKMALDSAKTLTMVGVDEENYKLKNKNDYKEVKKILKRD